MANVQYKLHVVRDDVNGITSSNPYDQILANFVPPGYVELDTGGNRYNYIFRSDLHPLIQTSGISIPSLVITNAANYGPNVIFDAYVGNLRITNYRFDNNYHLIENDASALSNQMNIFFQETNTMRWRVGSVSVLTGSIFLIIDNDNQFLLPGQARSTYAGSNATLSPPETGLYGYGLICPAGSSSATRYSAGNIGSPAPGTSAESYAIICYAAALSGLIEPNFESDTSSTGGGDGDYYDEDVSDDNAPISNADVAVLNQKSIMNYGFFSIYKPDSAALSGLSRFLWSQLFDPATFKKIFQDPIECIINVMMMPVAPTATTSGTIVFGNIDTQVSCERLTEQYMRIEAGELTINEKWGSALDYSPNTRCQLYLPFLGMYDIETDDVIGKTLSLVYIVDFLNGVITCQVCSNGNVHYQYNSSAGVNIPVTASNMTRVISALATVGIAAGTAAIGAAAAGSAAYGAATAASGDIAAVNNAVISAAGQSLVSSAPSLAGATAASVMSAKIGVQRAGGISQSAVLFNTRKPLIVLSRPRQSLAADYNTFYGYPANITMKLSECEGFTKVSDINLSGMSATAEELAQIVSCLKNGVII